MALYTVMIWRRWHMQERTELNIEARNGSDAEAIAERVMRNNPGLLDWGYQEPVSKSADEEPRYEHEFLATNVTDF